MERLRSVTVSLFALLLTESVGGTVQAVEWENPPTEISAAVVETPGSVRLRISLSEDVDPRSVEVQIAGREATIVARTTSGAEIRSSTFALREPATGEGAVAEYRDGWLTITLRKKESPP
jgi:HSP20 family molecular chaperone IbpA